MRTLISRWGGWGSLAAGAVLCAIGWYGVSGERFAERQIPYLASCTIPGAALIVAGAVLLAAFGADWPVRGGAPPPATPPATLAETAPVPEGAADVDRSGVRTGGPPLAVPGGTLAHDPGCPLVDGKPEATPLDETALRERDLSPCPICEPDLPEPPERPEPSDPSNLPEPPERRS
ncbi:hypothetical protein GCM10009801_39430 [Streptomyces albiaxialis]|uniref:Lipoprotein n=1 Tax=Streptomyces albiaxialis TaxID=329523 RepID=A0ABP5HNL8_9ACTN